MVESQLAYVMTKYTQLVLNYSLLVLKYVMLMSNAPD
jgi:hypothetical protein